MLNFIKLSNWILAIASIYFGHTLHAEHSNEGTIHLKELQQEALSNNLEIKEFQKELEANQALKSSSDAKMWPSLSLEAGYQSSNLDSETSNGVYGYGMANYNLYNGGKDSQTSKIKEEEVKFLRLKLQKSTDQVIREISKKYYTLLYLQEAISLKEEALRTNKSQADIAIKKQSAGFTSQADVLEFELREATLQSDLNLLKREESFQESELEQLLGRNSSTEIRVAGHLNRESLNINNDQLIQTAMQQNLEILEAEKNITLSELQKNTIKGDFLPKLDLQGKFGRLNSDDTIYQKNNNSLIRLNLSWPLFSGLETHYANEAQVALNAKNQLNSTHLKQEVKNRIENLISQLRSLEDRLNLEEKNILRAEKYYNITLQEYKKGVKNSPDVAGAAERLYDARLRNLEFRKDLLLNQLVLAQEVGIEKL